MRPWMKRGIIFILICSAILFGNFLLDLYENYRSQRVSFTAYDEDNWINPLDDSGIKDNLDIYREDEELTVDNIYITVFELPEQREEDLYGFEEFLRYDEDQESSRPRAEVFFQSGDKEIFENGIFIREPNATIEIRGRSSIRALQNSFKIRLFDREGLWNKQNVINLNKHYFDPLRIRSKLSFDYLKIIPDITSLRTRFVRLFIKDLSLKGSDEDFIDYGFFTQLEQPNRLFLKNHGLDSNAHLYKAENFKFLRYDEYIKNKNESSFSRKKFEEILEIRGEDNHQKLIRMLDDVNDYSKDINEVIDTHFDKENYLTWIAVNILFDNYQKINTDFLLYSPLNSNKWYFMPWHFEGAWNLADERTKWQRGLSMLWDNVLHQRFFKDPKNVEALNRKIEELSMVINKEKTQELLNSYYNIVMANITTLPDLKYLPVSLNNFREQYEELSNLPQRNKLYYYELLENPMPFGLKEPQYYEEDKIIFTWENSFDLQGDELYYDLELSTDRNFTYIAETIKDIKETNYVFNDLEKDTYYWRVTARDSKGNSQTPYNIFIDDFGDEYYGISQFVFNDESILSAFKKEDTDREIIEDIGDEIEEESKEENEEEIEEESDYEVIIVEDDSDLAEPKDIEKDDENTPLEENDTEEKTAKNDDDEKIIKNREDYDTYTLKPGETLYRVSVKLYGHRGMIEEIRRLSGIKDINNISVGTVLKVPKVSNNQYQAKIPRVYKLKAGDTLYSVSMKFYGNKEKIEEIIKLNNIKDIHDLSIGTTLKLPKR